MVRNFSTYQYRERCFSGDTQHPHVITLFAKGKTIRTLNLIPRSTFLGMLPLVSNAVAVRRAAESFKVLYKEGRRVKSLKSGDPHFKKCLNAGKNLLRASVESLPLIGNFSLMIFERIRLTACSKQLLGSLKEEEKETLGVAIEGRVVFTIKRASFDLLPEDQEFCLSDEVRLIWLNIAIDAVLKDAEKRDSFKKQALTELLPAALKKLEKRAGSCS